MSAPILELKNVNKSFGPIDVLNDISLRVHAGEVLCLLGDNGAGKSTLIKTLAGVYRPNTGEVLMDGRPVEFHGPRDAQKMGISTVHQFGGTFPLMSIGRSFFIGAEPTKGFWPFKVYDRKKANEIAVKAVREFGITRIDDGDRLMAGCREANVNRWQSLVRFISAPVYSSLTSRPQRSESSRRHTFFASSSKQRSAVSLLSSSRTR